MPNIKIYGDIQNWDTPKDGEGGSLQAGNDGLFTRTRTIFVRTVNPENYITYKAEHPDNADFILTAASAQENPGNVWEITLTYTGATGNVETYHYDTDTEASPIQAHPSYDELRAFANEDETTGEFLNFPPDKADAQHLTGITSWLDPRMTYTRNLVMKNSEGVLAGTQGDYFNVGRIFTDPPGYNPTIAGHDWLQTRATIDLIGGALRISQTFTMSGPFGWNTNLYEAASSGTSESTTDPPSTTDPAE